MKSNRESEGVIVSWLRKLKPKPTVQSPQSDQPCPYCGASSNLRCCEFGRDK